MNNLKFSQDYYMSFTPIESNLVRHLLTWYTVGDFHIGYFKFSGRVVSWEVMNGSDGVTLYQSEVLLKEPHPTVSEFFGAMSQLDDLKSLPLPLLLGIGWIAPLVTVLLKEQV